MIEREREGRMWFGRGRSVSPKRERSPPSSFPPTRNFDHPAYRTNGSHTTTAGRKEPRTSAVRGGTDRPSVGTQGQGRTARKALRLDHRVRLLRLSPFPNAVVRVC